ncbi:MULTISPECIES: MCE family protein [unclassified Nocardioides]|uniref:MCE family protein n=1 Tax=unclassified Nocardioides TaxID=2615069 RepID=UPI0006F41044|nr:MULTISPECIES: MCE family protein [unclassified Nocardioides]KQY57682.1 ABC transporter substrate-binding protein [Nocardioides sp. Root140]KQZ67674.1 ABC transporter substrate-binding protein [Nocardioides sp. Root151]
MSTPFREKNPVIIGAVSMAVIAAMILLAFRADQLPIIGGGDTYYASFSEAGGLKANDEVRVAGVRVGKVDKLELDGDHVKVSFRIKGDVDFGPESQASIKVKTLLGAMYLEIEPAGSGQMDEGDTIPIDRTHSPYDVIDAFEGLADRSDAIDVDQLKASLGTLAELTRNTPDEFKSALTGVSALSENLAARDQQINTLLKNLRKVSGVLGSRDDDIIQLMKDARVLFTALVSRRDAIHNLLVATSTMSQELTALVDQSKADLKPALTNLDTVVKVLLKNQDNLDESLRTMAPFYRYFASTLGNGPWFDTTITNLPPLPGGN